MTDRGTYQEIDGRPAVRFQRRYAHPVEAVWETVSTPEGLAHWFPSRVRIEPEAGGVITFFQGASSDDPNVEPMTGTVLAFDPPKFLAFTWGPDELRFAVEPTDGGGCLLTLTDILGATDTAARTAAGWHVCLAELARGLDGEADTGPHRAGAVPWKPLYDAYVADRFPSGAPIPGGGQ